MDGKTVMGMAGRLVCMAVGEEGPAIPHPFCRGEKETWEENNRMRDMRVKMDRSMRGYTNCGVTGMDQSVFGG